MLESGREFGSDFHLCLEEPFYHKDAGAKFFGGDGFSFFLSGRAALYAILKQGIERHGWRKVYFPSYYCHEVVQFVSKLNIETAYFSFNPFIDDEKTSVMIDDKQGNVVVEVLFFGVRRPNLSGLRHATVISDVSHDLLAHKKMQGQFCFASLRKQLPLPCGGFVYPEIKYNIDGVDIELSADELAAKKMSAMTLKRLYLQGQIHDKDLYRQLFSTAENALATEKKLSMPSFVIEILSNLDVNAIAEARSKNLTLLLSLIQQPTYFTNEIASGLFMRFGSISGCDQMKSYLINNNIFPATLWPRQTLTRDIETERTTLFVHTDYRYRESDIRHIAKTLNDFVDV